MEKGDLLVAAETLRSSDQVKVGCDGFRPLPRSGSPSYPAGEGRGGLLSYLQGNSNPLAAPSSDSDMFGTRRILGEATFFLSLCGKARFRDSCVRVRTRPEE